MGYRAHVCTTYQVRYSQNCDFYNGDFYPLFGFLRRYSYHDGKLNVDIDLLSYSDDSDDVWELDRTALEGLVAQLRNPEHRFPEELEECLRTLPSREVLADKFEGWLRNGDRENDFVRVEWF